MRILWHTWEPGLEGNDLTSGGGGAWTRFLFRKFNEHNWKVEWFEHDAPMLERSFMTYKPIDIAVFCWRWELPNLPQYETRNRARERQNFLIQWCIDRKIPFMVHDQDLKMTFEERDWVWKNHGHIFTPSFYPEFGELSLHFPNPYTFGPMPTRTDDTLVYVGNHYERLDQAARMTNGFAENVHTMFFGNWMERGPGRDPDEVRRRMPHVVFPGRLDQNRILDILGNARATILLHKEEYGPRGFVTIRWAEAAAAGVLPFIPEEFDLPSKWVPLLEGLRVSRGSEMLQRYITMSEDERIDLIIQFRNLVNQYMSHEEWLKTIERIVTHDGF